MSMIMNTNQKSVTLKEIAAMVGCSVSTAYKALHGKSTAEWNRKVQCIAGELGYNPMTSRRKSVTTADVAKAAGVCKDTVSRILSNGPKLNVFSPETIDRVRKAAQDLGYVTRTERRIRSEAAKAQSYYRNGNYHTREEEIARMNQLRAEGYSNREIAGVTGRSVVTVHRNLGSQPLDMTKMNVTEGQRNRRRRDEKRKTYVMTHEINQHNELVEKIERLNADINIAEQQLIRLRHEQAEMTQQISSNIPHIRKLSEKVGVPMKELPSVQVSLSDLVPTVIQ